MVEILHSAGSVPSGNPHPAVLQISRITFISASHDAPIAQSVEQLFRK